MKLIFAGVNRYLPPRNCADVLRIQPQFRCVHPHTNTRLRRPASSLFDIAKVHGWRKSLPRPVVTVLRSRSSGPVVISPAHTPAQPCFPCRFSFSAIPRVLRFAGGNPRFLPVINPEYGALKAFCAVVDNHIRAARHPAAQILFRRGIDNQRQVVGLRHRANRQCSICLLYAMV